MPVTVIVPDANLTGLSEPAKNELAAKIEQFATDLISESNRLEAANRAPNDAADVSAQMVRDASTFVRRGMHARPTAIGVRLGRLAAALLSLVVGIAWDRASLQDATYLMIFGLLIAATIIAVTFSVIKD